MPVGGPTNAHPVCDRSSETPKRCMALQRGEFNQQGSPSLVRRRRSSEPGQVRIMLKVCVACPGVRLACRGTIGKRLTLRGQVGSWLWVVCDLIRVGNRRFNRLRPSRICRVAHRRNRPFFARVGYVGLGFHWRSGHDASQVSRKRGQGRHLVSRP